MDRYPNSVRDAAFEMIRSGTTAVDLADRFDVSRGTAYLWLHVLQSQGEDVAFLKRLGRAKERGFALLAEGSSPQIVSEELGVSQAQLRRWVDIFEQQHSTGATPVTNSDILSPTKGGASVTRRRKASPSSSDVLISQLKAALAEKTLEVDFFSGAFREVKARRQQYTGSGEKPSTEE